MATWTEVRELAAKLKTTQERANVQSLSERTWVDIVRQLIATDRVKLIFTSDGRSYLTQDELEKEIREEVEAHDGRVSLAELASLLDVEQSIVETKLAEMVSFDAVAKTSDRLIGIPGEVISDSYLRQVAHEIRDRLEERGQTTVGELATIFSLPTSFLLNIMQQYQGVLFRLHKYGDEYITDAYLLLNKAKVRGYFMPLLRPAVLSSVASRLKMPESLLSNIVMTLINDGQLCGTLVAGRNTYIPFCYTDAETAYIKSFFTQNGYVEWDHLKRIGIAGPSSQQRSLLPNAIHLSSVSVGPAIVNQLAATIEEAAHDDSWVDLTHCFPPGVSPKDRLTIIGSALKKFPMKPIDDGLYLVSHGFLLKCLAYFDEFLHSRAEVAMKDRPISSSLGQQDKCEQDTHIKHSTHTIKGGFGMGAREIKTKNVKRKYAVGKRKTQAYSDGGQHDKDLTGENDVDTADSIFEKYVSNEEVFDLLTAKLSSDVPHVVMSGIVELIWPELARSFSKLLSSIFLPNSDATRNREMVNQTQETASNMLYSIQLMERGINAISRPDLQTKLIRHLVKTQGTCLVDRLCVHLAKYYDLRWPSSESGVVQLEKLEFVVPLTGAQRNELVDLLRKAGSVDAVQAAASLNKLLEKLRAFQLSETSMVDYYSCLEALATEHLGLSLPTLPLRADNKRKKEERNKANELALQMEMQLQNALQQCQTDADVKEAATATLAASCLFSQVITGWPITAPGKLVPELVDWLSEVKLQKATHASGAANQAFSKLMESTAIDHLQALTAKISRNMHSGEPLSADSDLVTDLKEVFEVAKACRKILYS